MKYIIVVSLIWYRLVRKIIAEFKEYTNDVVCELCRKKRLQWVLYAFPCRVANGVIRKQLASALDIVVHLARLRDGSRRIVEIQEVAGTAYGEIVCNPLFRFVEEGDEHGRILGRLAATGNKLQFPEKLYAAGIRQGSHSTLLAGEAAS
jgi:hypothetical protein